jgi:hypothetical protein
MLINLMKKNVGKLESVVFGGIFEIWSKDGSTFFIAFSSIKILKNLKNPVKKRSNFNEEIIEKNQ